MIMFKRNTRLNRIVRRIVAAWAEINYAQRRLDAIRTNSDRYLPDAYARQGPENYAEFLFRTSGVLLHEPPAGRRSRGQLVR
jgi:hypothetical protein